VSKWKATTQNPINSPERRRFWCWRSAVTSRTCPVQEEAVVLTVEQHRLLCKLVHYGRACYASWLSMEEPFDGAAVCTSRPCLPRLSTVAAGLTCQPLASWSRGFVLTKKACLTEVSILVLEITQALATPGWPNTGPPTWPSSPRRRRRRCPTPLVVLRHVGADPCHPHPHPHPHPSSRH